MNPVFLHPLHRGPQRRLAAAALALLVGAAAPALAGPGAHGPNGEHLDEAPVAAAGPARPRVEAHSEAFELVGEWRAGELTIHVDRYETNEPVLDARLEVESGPHQAVAVFRAEQGDYAVTDPALLKALAEPGEHALVFTLVAGADSDLLDGTLAQTGARSAAAGADEQGHAHDGNDHGHDPGVERSAWIGAGAAALGLIGAAAWWRQRRRATPASGVAP